MLIPHQLEIPIGGLTLLWQLPWILFKTQKACCYYINQVTVFQWQSRILGNFPSHPNTAVATFHVLNLYGYRRMGCWGLYLSQGVTFLIHRGRQCLMSQDTESREDYIRLSSKCLSTYPDSTKAYS